MEFQVGDKVIHSAHGFAEIIKLEKKEISGKASIFYVVQTSDLLLWIPVHSAEKGSLRLPTSRTEFNGLFTILRSHCNPLSDNRMERKSQVHIRINEGNSESICRLIRDLSFYRRNKKLNDYETSIFERAVRILVDEWQFSMSISQSQAKSELNLLLDESYSKSII